MVTRKSTVVAGGNRVDWPNVNRGEGTAAWADAS